MACIDSGWISSQGEFVKQFEAAFRKHAQMPYAVTTSNCTTALHLVLISLGVEAGDEVLCPDLTFIAPANMIALCGATPILVDVEPESWALDPTLIEAALTNRTKGIVVVHPFGHAADMDPILKLAKQHNLFVIEDVAEAIDALYKGKPVGTFGDAACYSFFANKIMTTGEGGIVLCRDAGLDERLQIYRDHGMSRERRYHHVVSGFNYRMTNMQAAVGLAQLQQLGNIELRRDRQAARYAARFEDHTDLFWRPTTDWCRSVHWLSTITLKDESLRDPLLTYLAEQGIEGRPMIFPVHDAVPFRDGNDPARFPVSHNISYRSLHLPSSTDLSDQEIDLIADTVTTWLSSQ